MDPERGGASEVSIAGSARASWPSSDADYLRYSPVVAVVVRRQA